MTARRAITEIALWDKLIAPSKLVFQVVHICPEKRTAITKELRRDDRGKWEWSLWPCEEVSLDVLASYPVLQE